MRGITALREGIFLRNGLHLLIAACVWIVSAKVCAVELHESLDRAAMTVVADCWAIASGPQWPPGVSRSLSEIGQQG